jgi:hypothetical protein
LDHREEVCFILRGDRRADSVDGRQKMVGTKALRLAARFVLLSVEPFDNTILAQMHAAVNDEFSGDCPQVEECSDLRGFSTLQASFGNPTIIADASPLPASALM